MMRLASTLPSSTPHWSKESMPQIDALHEHAVLVERDQRAERCAASGARRGSCCSGRLPSIDAERRLERRRRLRP